MIIEGNTVGINLASGDWIRNVSVFNSAGNAIRAFGDISNTLVEDVVVSGVVSNDGYTLHQDMDGNGSGSGNILRRAHITKCHENAVDILSGYIYTLVEDVCASQCGMQAFKINGDYTKLMRCKGETETYEALSVKNAVRVHIEACDFYGTPRSNAVVGVYDSEVAFINCHMSRLPGAKRGSFVARDSEITIKHCNIYADEGRVLDIFASTLSADFNTYYFRQENTAPFYMAGNSYTFEQWQAAGYDPHSTVVYI